MFVFLGSLLKFFGAITLEQNAEDCWMVVRNVNEIFSIDDC